MSGPVMAPPELKSFALTDATAPVKSFFLDVSNPTEVITRALTLAGTFNRNDPSAPVEAPLVDPLGTTEAPTIGLPSLESITFPVTTLSCAWAERETNSSSPMRALQSNRNTAVIIANFCFLVVLKNKSYLKIKYLIVILLALHTYGKYQGTQTNLIAACF